MEFKKIVFLSVLAPFVCGTLSHAKPQKHLTLLEKRKWHEVVLRVILNDSDQAIELYDNNKKETVSLGKIVLKQRFQIPFASMKTYMKHIINDLPYIPSNALKIKTQAGILGLWEDERGILYCKDNDALDENVVQNLFDRNKLRLALALTLQINKAGTPKLMG